MKKQRLSIVIAILFTISCLALKAQNNVGISDDGSEPATNAILDVKSLSKGLLIPRVALLDTANPIGGYKPVGLMVWNTSNTGNYALEGFYFWNGNDWTKLSDEFTDWQKNNNNLFYNNGYVGIGTNTPKSKLEIKADATTTDNEVLFAVKNKNGDTIMAVYNSGVVFQIDTTTISKGKPRGIVVKSSATSTKGTTELFKITPDSTCFFIDDSNTKGKPRGIVVKSSATSTKGTSVDYFRITPNSTSIYTTQGGDGFSVSNIGSTATSSYLDITPKNMFIGEESGILTTGLYNSFFGYQSGKNNTTGASNVFIGYQSGYNHDLGGQNIFIGEKAGYDNSGTNNIFVGFQSGLTNGIGANNIFLGTNAGSSNAGGNGNIFMGTESGFLNASGNNNVLIGQSSGYSTTDGDRNVVLGFEAGYSNIIGNQNVFIGNQAGYFETGSNKLYVTTQKGANLAGGVSSALIYGEFDNQILQFNAKVGIKKTPAFDFDVNGNINFTGDIYKNGVLSTNPWLYNSSNIYFTAGSVAIGTNTLSSDYKFQIYGTTPNYMNQISAAITCNSAGSAALNFVGDLDGDETGTRTGVVGLDFESNTMKIAYGQNLFENLSGIAVASDGKVGVGTAYPVKKLHVEGDINFTGQLYKNGELFSGTSLWAISGGTNLYYDGGNVGIGTTTPTANLEVAGNLKVTQQINTVNTSTTNINVSQTMNVSGQFNGVKTNGYSTMRGFLQNIQLAYVSESMLTIYSGYLTIGDTLYYSYEMTISNTFAQANTFYFCYATAPTVGTAISSSNISFSTTAPQWRSDFMGWYDNNARCIGMIYTDANSFITPFDYIDGNYKFRTSYQYVLGTRGVATTLVLSQVPSCSRLAYTLAYLELKNLNGSTASYKLRLYVHPVLASTSSAFVALSGGYFDQMALGQGLISQANTNYVEIPILPNGNITQFSYYVERESGDDNGAALLFVNGFYWRADKR